MAWTAKDFIDTSNNNPNQSIKTNRGKWTADDFNNVSKPQPNKVVASPTPTPTQIPKPIQPAPQPKPLTFVERLKKLAVVQAPQIKQEEVDNWYQQEQAKREQEKQKLNKANPFVKFGARVNQTAGGQYDSRINGNKVMDFIADGIGGSIGIMGNSAVGNQGLNQFSNTVSQKVGSKVLDKVGSKALSNAARIVTDSTISNAPVSAIQGASEGLSNKDIAKKVAADVGGGIILQGAFEGVGHGIGKGISKVKENINTPKGIKDIAKVLKNGDISNEHIGQIKSNTKLPETSSKISDVSKQIPSEVADTKIKIGDYVKAKDQNNFGKIVGTDGNGNYRVSFTNKKTGSQATVTLNEYQLQLTGKGRTINKPQQTSKIQNSEELPEPSSKIVSSKNSNKTTLGQKLNKAYTKAIDSQHPLTQFSKVAKDNTNIIASNTRNAGGTVDYIIKDALVDKQGNHIGESLQNIIKGIPKGKEEKFWEYALHKHNVARVGQNKPVYTNYTADMSEQAYKQLEKEHPEFSQVSQRLNDYLKKFTKAWGVDAGTVDKALMDNLNEMYPNYIPTNRAFSDLERGNLNLGKKGFVNQKAPIKKATGSSRDIINPTESIMNLVNKTVRSAKYNEVGQSLVNSLRKNPEGLKGFAEILPTNKDIVNNINKTLQDEGIDGLTNHIADQFDEVASKGHLKGNNIVTVMENGQPIQVKINNKELLDTLTGLNKSNIGEIEKFGRWLTNPYKAVITTKNPLFAIKNVARDLPTAYINGSENNPIKFIRNYGKATKDILFNGDMYKKYKAVGGGQSNFFNADKVSDIANTLTKKKGLLGKTGDFFENLNNATETAPRLAEFEKVYKDTGDINKALNAANEVTTNFARGGNITKTVDAYVPYLNASMQGLDKIRRQIIDKPLQTIGKGALSITVPSVALYMMNKDNPNYQNLDNRTKDNNYLIPNSDGTFTKIPKSRELGVLFGSLFERLSRQANGENNAFKNFGNTVTTNISPTNPAENNLFSPVITNLPSNKDFAGRQIVPTNLQKLSPQYQYDEKTSEIAKKIGEIAKLSPKQIDYLIKSYTGIFGQIGQPMATKNGNPVKAVTSQFTADPLYNNEVLNDFYNNLDMLDRKAADRNFVEKIPSKAVTPEERLRNQFAKANKQLTDIGKIIKQLQAQDPVGNEQKIREYQQLKLDIANRMNTMIK